MPLSVRCIPAVDAGGVAGGRKFSCGGLFIKLALDDAAICESATHCCNHTRTSPHPLCPCCADNGDENACKAAGHERKGYTAIIECRKFGSLRFPLVNMVRVLCVLSLASTHAGTALSY